MGSNARSPKVVGQVSTGATPDEGEGGEVGTQLTQLAPGPSPQRPPDAIRARPRAARCALGPDTIDRHQAAGEGLLRKPAVVARTPLRGPRAWRSTPVSSASPARPPADNRPPGRPTDGLPPPAPARCPGPEYRRCETHSAGATSPLNAGDDQAARSHRDVAAGQREQHDVVGSAWRARCSARAPRRSWGRSAAAT